MKFLTLPVFILAIAMFSFSSCDKCRKVDCQNGGTCNEGTCECPDGTEGTSCETVWRDAIIGTYQCIRTCEGSSQDTITVTINTDNAYSYNAISVNFDGGQIPCTMTGKNTFAFTQAFWGDSYGLTGDVNGDVLTMTQNSTSSFLTITCTFEGKR